MKPFIDHPTRGAGSPPRVTRPARRALRRQRSRQPLAGASLYLAALPLLCYPAASPAAGPFFATTSQNPFIQVYSLPNPSIVSRPSERCWSWQLSLDMANHAILDTHPAGERMALDGESYRGQLSVARSLGAGYSIGLELPFVGHSGGMFDGLLRTWHDTWGMSNARRDNFEDYGLEYSYERDGIELVSMRQRGKGPGDARIFAEWQLPRQPRGNSGRELALRGGIKLPTGSETNLRGSGSTDLSLQVIGRDTLARWQLDFGWMAGVLRLGATDLLPENRRDTVAIASAGVRRPVWSRISAIAQLDAHSAFYDSRLRSLGAAGVQLSVGGRIDTRGGHRFDFAVVENLRTDTTPDFGIHLAWSMTAGSSP